MPTWNDMRTTPDVRREHSIRDLKSHAIQSQYSASPRMLDLMEGFQTRLEPRADIDLFYESMFDIRTASGAGLDNWGRIVGVARIIEDEDTSLTLEDEPYRMLLLYKALANISASDAATLNKLLHTLMGSGIGGFNAPAYVLEVGPMVIRWVFEDFMDPIQLAVFRVAGTLARGAGVGWEIYAVNPETAFGFDGSEMQPFNQAPFAPDNALTTGR